MKFCQCASSVGPHELYYREEGVHLSIIWQEFIIGVLMSVYIFDLWPYDFLILFFFFPNLFILCLSKVQNGQYDHKLNTIRLIKKIFWAFLLLVLIRLYWSPGYWYGHIEWWCVSWINENVAPACCQHNLI